MKKFLALISLSIFAAQLLTAAEEKPAAAPARAKHPAQVPAEDAKNKPAAPEAASADKSKPTDEPAPIVRLTTLSGGALGFELRMCTPLGVAQHPELLSALNFAIMKELGQRGVALKE